ncbi:MAG: immunoglobulin domain-containing protein [Verrucomicrobiota bacterium]
MNTNCASQLIAMGQFSAPRFFLLLACVYIFSGSNRAIANSPITAWGYNYYGQTNVPAGLTNVVTIAAGDSHNLVLLANGTLVAWGNNANGRTNVPAGLSNVIAIAAGSAHNLALKADGTVTAWGLNTSGQTNVPAGLTNVVAVAGGISHSLALKNDGTIVAWGTNNYGQMNVPLGLSGVVALAAGPANHCLALKGDGTIVAWGFNNYSQATVPAGLSNVVAISVGNSNSLALKTDGSVVAWGYNNYGQGSVPGGISNVVAIAAGNNHNVVLKTDGSVVAWGYNAYKQSAVPVGVSNVVAVVGGGNHTLALAGNGPPFIAAFSGSMSNLTLASTMTAFLCAQATGALPLSYQWNFNGTNIPGATNAVLVLTDLHLEQSGSYSITVSNAFGTTNSATTLLRVSPVGFTAQPNPQAVLVGNGATFSVTPQGRAPFSYQWLFNGTNLSGATNAVLTLTNVQKSQTGTYSVMVSTAEGMVISSNVTLTVLVYTFTTMAGLNGPVGTNDGFRSAARFGTPHGMALDGNGNVYVSDLNHTIRKITPDGWVTTIAGAPGSSGTNDGPVATARFNSPWDLMVDSGGTVYVADTLNNTIRKITTDGMVSTYAGVPAKSGSSDGAIGMALFYGPDSIVLDRATNMYVADFYNSTIRKITPGGIVSTLAGSPGATGTIDGLGGAARFTRPAGIGIDKAGNIFVADEYSSRMRKVTPTGMVSTFAGNTSTGTNDGQGAAARFNFPHSAAVDSAGNVYVGDALNYTVRVVTPDAIVTTVAGLAGTSGSADGTGCNARFKTIGRIVVDTMGNLYLTDEGNRSIRKGVPFAVNPWPQSQGVPSGQNVTLNVGASGDGPFAFQWTFNDVPLPGQTNANLDLGPVTRTNAGVYSVLVTNALGNWCCVNATVRALLPPVLQPPKFSASQPLHLVFQDTDGGVPSDLSLIQLLWRTNLPSGVDTNWQSFSSGFYLTNGSVMFDDTNTASQPPRFYRLLYR